MNNVYSNHLTLPSSFRTPYKPNTRASVQSESPTRCDSYSKQSYVTMDSNSPSKYTSSVQGSKGKMRPAEKCYGSPTKKSTSAKCKAVKNSKTHSKTLATSEDLE